MKTASIHTPANMKPADYTVLLVALLYTEECLETGRDITVFELEPVSDESDAIWRGLGQPTVATASHDGNPVGRCQHCNHALKYYCLVLHTPTGELIEVGRDCVQRFWNLDWSVQEMNFQARKRREANTAKFLAKYPDAAESLTWALEGDGRKSKFAREVAEDAVVNGYDISEKKAAAFVESYRISLLPIPYKVGRRVITGTITKCTAQKNERASGYHYTAYDFKITVLTDEGFKIWGTLPGDFSPALPANADKVVGQRVEFTATVEGVRADFATYSRPSKFQYTELPEEWKDKSPDYWNRPEPTPEPVAEAPAALPDAPGTFAGATVPPLDCDRETWKMFRAAVYGQELTDEQNDGMDAIEDARTVALGRGMMIAGQLYYYPKEGATADQWKEFLLRVYAKGDAEAYKAACQKFVATYGYPATPPP